MTALDASELARDGFAQNRATASAGADIPPHVPRERVVDVDLYRIPGAERDLHSAWTRLRDVSGAGLLWTPCNGGHWIVTRGREIARIYADHENFSSNITIVPRQWGEQYPLRPTTLDPPSHRPYRRIVAAALSTRLVRAAEPIIRELAGQSAERLRERGRCEFISDFAAPLPTRLFMHLAELPPQDAFALPAYAEDPVRSEGGADDAPVMDRFADFLRPRVAERQAHPGNDLISEVVTGTVDGHRMSEDEAVELMTAVLTGGLDTVVSSLGFMMAFLARSPAHRRRLVHDPAIMRNAVCELLRRFPIMTKARLLKRDQDIEGVRLKAGEMIVLPPLHALDAREFADPLAVDFDRPPAPNSTFGNGVHRCPGALLAEAELGIALHEWLVRIPDFELDPLRPPKMQGGVLGAMLRLDLQWDAPTTRSVHVGI